MVWKVELTESQSRSQPDTHNSHDVVAPAEAGATEEGAEAVSVCGPPYGVASVAKHPSEAQGDCILRPHTWGIVASTILQSFQNV